MSVIEAPSCWTRPGAAAAPLTTGAFVARAAFAPATASAFSRAKGWAEMIRARRERRRSPGARDRMIGRSPGAAISTAAITATPPSTAAIAGTAGRSHPNRRWAAWAARAERARSAIPAPARAGTLEPSGERAPARPRAADARNPPTGSLPVSLSAASSSASQSSSGLTAPPPGKGMTLMRPPVGSAQRSSRAGA